MPIIGWCLAHSHKDIAVSIWNKVHVTVTDLHCALMLIIFSCRSDGTFFSPPCYNPNCWWWKGPLESWGEDTLALFSWPALKAQCTHNAYSNPPAHTLTLESLALSHKKLSVCVRERMFGLNARQTAAERGKDYSHSTCTIDLRVSNSPHFETPPLKVPHLRFVQTVG